VGNSFQPTERFRINGSGVDTSIKLGGGVSGNRYGFIDIVTDNTYTDFGLRLIRDNTGANGHSQLTHRGTGNLYVGAMEAGKVVLRTNAADRVTIDATGNVGIGTAAPSAKLHVAGTTTITGALSSGTLSVTGDVSATGNIAAKYQDVAEWVPSRQLLVAGTVVVLDSSLSNHVVASSASYDTRVAGVVSAKPGVILGESGSGKVMVATTGRVRIKVDATRGAILVGDLLVTSEREGYAMRSEPVDLGGTKLHRPGTLIGKALEPLATGTGEILVLLSLQ
jgi:hypothetical protein